MPDTFTDLDRCERYRTRLDAFLATLPDDRARRAFADREAAKWLERYATFRREVDSGRYEGNATAFEFLITLSDVEIRRMRYGATVPA